MAKKKKNGTNSDIPKDDSSALAKPNESSLAIPEGDFNAGMDNFDINDIILPRLILCQLMTRCSDVDDKSTPQPGEYFNSLTMEKFAPPIEIVPLFYNKRAILFPDKMEEPIICMAADGKTGNTYGKCVDCEDYYNQWKEGEPPRCAAIHEFTCLFASDETEELPMPFLTCFMRTSYGIGSKLGTLIQMSRARKHPPFAYKYELGAIKKENDKGKYYVSSIRAAGRVDATKFLDAYNMLSGAHKAGKISTEYQEAPDRYTVEGSDIPDFDDLK